ncbi:trypsin-like peptidase domain-containing protein [Acetanaerobacterium sp. MSJ-12]|uniref:S1C family serine protease n=1 Tax=Acetanaerobacterium sp. MSJ-12 TaxID=2841535 RepID=UPI00257009FF|nr:trypsin-like peptidase domain-containing protein [Acetanaerobacterium sp. MSJ-12]
MNDQFWNQQHPTSPPPHPSQPAAPYSPYAPYAAGTAPCAPPPKKARKKMGAKAKTAALVTACCMGAGLFGFGGTVAGNLLTRQLSGGSPVLYQGVPTQNTSTGENSGTVSAVAAKAAPSVVAITTETMQGYYGRVQQSVATGAGSGVILTADGYIATNNHVISGASKITVTLSDGTQYPATLVGTDAQNDLAVIKIEASGLQAAVLGSSSSLQVGDLAVAIGNPLGELGGTVTDGIISALDRNITVDGETMTLLQISAAVNPGNSGGGLFDKNGELVGIVNAKSSGTGIEGLGFAIPIDTAKPILEKLMAGGGDDLSGQGSYGGSDATQTFPQGGRQRIY